jgi:hypothetical protein
MVGPLVKAVMCDLSVKCPDNLGNKRSLVTDDQTPNTGGKLSRKRYDFFFEFEKQKCILYFDIICFDRMFLSLV